MLTDVGLVDGSAGSCNALTPNGNSVTDTFADGAVPSPQGGTIADGTYFLTANINYLLRRWDGLR